MITRVGAFRHGVITLKQLVDDLRGLYLAADPHDPHVRDAFDEYWSPIDVELAFRTELWAPAGTANEQTLAAALVDFESWINELLASNDDQHG
jgi:hypothetical protein